MNKVNLIALVVKKKEKGMYEHHMMPGDARITCTSAASSGYVSGVIHSVKAIRPFAPIALAMVTPWDDDAGTYEVCISVSFSSIALLGPEFEALMHQKSFCCKKWPENYEFSKIIHELEIPSVLESLESFIIGDKND